MAKVKILLLALGFAGITHSGRGAPQDEWKPIAVKIERKGKGYELLRGGKPYFIKGVGYVGPDLKGLSELGANSIRTWGPDAGTEALLNDAHARGITVALGLWMLHESSFDPDRSAPRDATAFDYSNAESVRKQLEEMRLVVRRYRNHPALLLWGVGNEVPLNSRHHREIMCATNEIAKMIKEEDPAHPTIAVICRLSPDLFKLYRECCPDVDILGINGYRDMESMPGRLASAGWDRPYVVSEFGADGPWEVERTPWNAPLEPTSTEKAGQFKRTYESLIKGPPNCLGSYAFVWCDKQDGILPWFNLQLPGYLLTESADVLSRFWTGREPQKRAPRIKDGGISIRFNGYVTTRRWAEFPPEGRLECEAGFEASTPGSVRVEWRLREESPGSDPLLGKLIRQAEGKKAVLVLPPGEATACYRLTVYVFDDQAHVASVGMPLRVSKYYNP